MGIALICAVLFFLNVWRRTWLLPSMGLALLVLSAILLGLIWPGIVQQFQVKPSEADKESAYIEKNIEATRDGLRHRHGGAVQVPQPGQDRQPARPRRGPERHLDPAGRPAAGAPRLRAEPAGPRLLLGRRRARRRPLRHQRRRPRPGPRRPRARPGPAQRRRPELAEPAHRLHPRQRRHRGVRQPAQQPGPGAGRQRHQQRRQDPVGPGLPVRPGRPRAGPGEYETRVYFGENSPDYSVVGKTSESAARAPRRSTCSARVRPTPPQPRPTTVPVACRSARRSASSSTPSSSAAPTSCSRAACTRTPR